MYKKVINNFFQLFNLKLIRVRRDGLPLDFNDKISEIIFKYKDYTMTSPEKMKVLIDSVNYVCNSNILGDFVECGVWKGGSGMVVAHTLLENNNLRHIYLFDAYDLIIPAPTNIDKGVDGVTILGGAKEPQQYWNAITEKEVNSNFSITYYPKQYIHTVKGLVTETIPLKAPLQICILRLDTDTYESTQHNLFHLYPRLSLGGVLIIDDYGSHNGVRKAVDEYFEKELNQDLFLVRVDNSGLIVIKK